MRERLLAAFLSLTLLTVLLYGVPRALVRADIVDEEARQDLDRSAQAVAALVDVREQAGLAPGALDLDFLRAGDQVLLRSPAGEDVLAGPPSESAQLRDPLIGRAGLAGGGSIEVRRPREVVRQDVVRAVRPIVLTGLVALLVAALTGVLLAGRMARPFRRLADEAAVLGEGRLDVDLPPQRVREAEAIAAALRASSRRITRLIEREREFARNASHQLRTPLTGMRLRVEDVASWPETPSSVREELVQVLGEVDRLSSTVTSLLAFAREEQMADWEPVALAELLRAVVDRWQPLARERDRTLVMSGAPADVVPLPRIAVEQVLDVLVDNALKHGAGQVTIDAAVDEQAVQLLVGDEGAPLSPERRTQLFLRRRRREDRSRGEGIGLSLCADLAQSLGGRLRLLDAGPTTFELRLPRRPG